MGLITGTGDKREKGFTLVELLVVLAVVVLLAGLAAPAVHTSIKKAEESVLKKNLQVLRKALDDYYADRGRYPAVIEELAEKKYIRKIPEDPVTGSVSTWILLESPEGGIYDIRSGAYEKSMEGDDYYDW